jgi:hypothetical protein
MPWETLFAWHQSTNAYAGSFKPFVAEAVSRYYSIIDLDAMHTFEMEEDVGLIILEHLSYKLRVHVLDVDFLEVLVQHHDSLVQFLLQ